MIRTYLSLAWMFACGHLYVRRGDGEWRVGLTERGRRFYGVEDIA